MENKANNNWTIEAKILPLVAGISGHLYLEVFDGRGKRVCQINGLATNPVTQEPRSIGIPGDLIKAYVGTFTLRSSGNGDRATHPHEGRLLFSGSEKEVREAIAAMKERADEINRLNVPYFVFGINSNTVFSSFVEAMAETVSIDMKAVDEMKSIRKILPGVRLAFNGLSKPPFRAQKPKPPQPGAA